MSISNGQLKSHTLHGAPLKSNNTTMVPSKNYSKVNVVNTRIIPATPRKILEPKVLLKATPKSINASSSTSLHGNYTPATANSSTTHHLPTKKIKSHKKKHKRDATFYNTQFPTTLSFPGFFNGQTTSNGFQNNPLQSNYNDSPLQSFSNMPIMPVPDSIYADPAHELENLQNKLSVYPESFIDDRNKLIIAIKNSLQENEDEFYKLREKLQNMRNQPKAKINKIVEWLKLKRKESEMLNEDLRLLDELSAIVTKLEVAKYVAYAKKAAETASQSTDNTFYTTSYNQQNPYQQPQADFSNIFQVPFKRIYDPSQYYPYQSGNSFIKKENIYKCNDKNCAPRSAHSSEKYFPEEKSRSEMSLEDTLKAINAINYVQEKAGLDGKAITKLITDLKALSYDDMMNKKRSLQNNLYEFKRSLISRPDMQKSSDMYKKEREFLDARERYMFIKETEWIVTRIEAAKYAALAKFKTAV